VRYEGKVTIVTGGTHGIGEGCVRVFANAGAQVVFCGRGAKDGRDLERKVQAGGGTVHFVRCDVSKEKEVRALVDGTFARFGRIDCLINNAGWHPPHRPIDDFTADDFRELIEVNLVSMFVACQQALPYLRKTKGNIINMSSLVGSMGQLHATTYVATKGAVTAFSKALAIDEAAHGVRVNSISPGNVYTPLWQQAIDAAPDRTAARNAGDTAQVMARMGTPEEVGRLCLYLAADATFTTGVDHIISGGAEIGYGRKA
jgi:NAD(P)-dependent dehydrogenase (short-subunit alcohol dehydrogenase family)